MEQVCYARSSPKSALVWTTVAFFAGFAGVSAYGPIVPKLKAYMGMGPVFMGLLGAIPVLTGSLLRIPFGALVDRMGGKRLLALLLGLSAAGILGITVMFDLFPNPGSGQYPLFLLFGMLCGCGIASFSVGVPTVSYWYPQRRQGIALAIYGGLGNLAPGLFALLLPPMVERAGLFVSYLLWVILLVAFVFVFLLFMKDAPYFQYRELGIEIDEEALLIACGQELFPKGSVRESLRKAANDHRTWILTVFYFVTFGGFIALTLWFPTYWTEYFGVSLVRAGFLTGLYSLLASLFRLLGGTISDRIGGEKALGVSFCIVLAGSILMCWPSTSYERAVAGEVFLALGMGFSNAAVFKLIPKFMPASVGGTAGIVGGLGAFGGFTIPIVLAYFVKARGDAGYPLGFSVFLVSSCICLALGIYLGKSGRKKGSKGVLQNEAQGAERG